MKTIKRTRLRVSSLLRDGHRNKRQTTSAPPDPPKSSPFLKGKILCLVLVLRRRRRRRSSGAHHSRHGKHDFNDDINTPLLVFFSRSGLLGRESNTRKRRGEFSLFRGLSRSKQEKAISVRNGTETRVFFIQKFGRKMDVAAKSRERTRREGCTKRDCLRDFRALFVF